MNKTTCVLLFFFLFCLSPSHAHETKQNCPSNLTEKPDPLLFKGVPDLIEDGDSFWIGIHKVRLHGIDAPEAQQTCGKIPCGQESRKFLIKLIASNIVTCKLEKAKYGKPWISYGRYVVKCDVIGLNINKEMVRAGWAIASKKSWGDDYRQLQQQAESTGLGMHATHFITPWDWRKRKKKRIKQCTEDHYLGTSFRGKPLSRIKK